MNPTVKITLLLCTFGFFRELRPSEPFSAQFFMEWRNVTKDKINRELWPVGTYSYMAQLIIVFLVTDILRYKPIIVLSAGLGIIMWSLMLWTGAYAWLMVVQLCYGTFMAAEVAYYTYMYAKVRREEYQKVTSHTRAAITSGKFLSGALAQILISFELMNTKELNYVALGAQIISLLLAVLLPSVTTSIYFYTKSEVDVSSSQDSVETSNKSEEKFSCDKAMTLIKEHFLQSYSNKSVLYWSIWWALATGGFIQAQTYAQILWDEIDPTKENFFNGAVEAMYTLVATCSALLAGFIDMNFFNKHHLWIITGCSIIQGALVIYEGLTENVLIAYGMYVLFGTIYQFMITLISACVAKQLVDDSFALVFGINTFLALVFQALFTVIVVGDTGLALTPRNQYVVNGGYFLVLAVLYLIFAIFERTRVRTVRIQQP